MRWRPFSSQNGFLLSWWLTAPKNYIEFEGEFVFILYNCKKWIRKLEHFVLKKNKYFITQDTQCFKTFKTFFWSQIIEKSKYFSWTVYYFGWFLRVRTVLFYYSVLLNNGQILTVPWSEKDRLNLQWKLLRKFNFKESKLLYIVPTNHTYHIYIYSSRGVISSHSNSPPRTVILFVTGVRPREDFEKNERRKIWNFFFIENSDLPSYRDINRCVAREYGVEASQTCKRCGVVR